MTDTPLMASFLQQPG